MRVVCVCCVLCVCVVCVVLCVCCVSGDLTRAIACPALQHKPLANALSRHAKQRQYMQQAQYNPGYAMQMQQYYAQYGVAAGGPTPHPAFHPPPQPGYQVQCSSAAASSPPSPPQAEEQTAE